MLSLGIGLTSIPVLQRRGPAYDPDALAFFARLTNQPTDARKKLYSDLIVALKAAGVWSKLDALYILAAADAQAARQNLVANAYNLTASGSPAFTADRGYTGDGVAAYLATGLNPSLGGTKYTQDSATLAVWARTEVQSNTAFDIGTGISSYAGVNGRRTGSLARFFVNSATIQDVAISPDTSIGLAAFSRTGAALSRGYKNGVPIGSDITVASTALVNDTIRLLCAANFYSSRQVSAGMVGGGMTAADHAALYAAINTYLTAVGA